MCNVGIAMGNQMVIDMKKNYEKEEEDEDETQ